MLSSKRSSKTSPLVIVADSKNKMFELPGFIACGQAGSHVRPLSSDELIPLPQGSQLFFLPKRTPIALNAHTGMLEQLEGISPVAAFIPPGYTQLFSAAYEEERHAPLLPLYSYAAVAFYKGAFHVAAMRVDRRENHDICSLDKRSLQKSIRAFESTRNRLIIHLRTCALKSFCPNALNFFLKRYECPLPSSPACNAHCLGCISYQPKGSCPATQARLAFVPTPEELAEVALLHIKAVRDPVVSFGQGCEGEPLLSSKVIGQAVRMIRRETPQGTIHMNTNASLPGQIDELCSSGLDSIRVSMNSVREGMYTRYYAPKGYAFKDVVASIRMARKHKKFVSLNYLVMPGMTDREDEFNELLRFIKATQLDMIQWRNLNYDPQRYFKALGVQDTCALLGMKEIFFRLKRAFPKLHHGYFNLPKNSF